LGEVFTGVDVVETETDLVSFIGVFLFFVGVRISPSLR
jgi:hypothetical protein